MLSRLKAEDPVVRAAAARGLATLKATGATGALTEAVSLAARDGLYVARAAAIDALVALDPAAARPVLAAALTDKDWAVRVRAAEHLRRLDPAADISRMRPAPPPSVPELAAVDTFVEPKYSPSAYIDTAKGTIQFELAVLDAPRTVANFIALVRKGYFRGVQLHRVVPDFVVQDGDPRGDGEGGPGYTIRDEINQRPYLRGTVGMALDWADTGGSQFFITHSPQPHLDAPLHGVRPGDCGDGRGRRALAVGHHRAHSRVGRGELDRPVGTANQSIVNRQSDQIKRGARWRSPLNFRLKRTSASSPS